MPAHPEMQLLSRVIRDGCLKQVLEWGITHNDFRTGQGRAMWTHLYGFFSDAASKGAVLGMNTVQLTYPNFELCDDTGMTTEALCKIVRETRIILEAKQYLAEAQDAIELKPDGVLVDLRRHVDSLIELGSTKNMDVSFSNSIEDIVIDYEKAESGISMSRISWPWKALNEEMGGVAEDDYIVLYGRPKSMKSWILSYLIAHFSHSLDLRVLVYTKEMTPKNLFRRIAACMGELPYQELRFGRLTPVEKDVLLDIRDIAQGIRKKDNLWCLSGKDTPDSGAGDTVPWLMSKVEKYKPDVVLIDGVYLMSTGKPNQRDHARVQSISRECRQMILHTGVPVIATAQANRNAAGHQSANLDEIAHSDALGQDATAAFRVINEKQSPTIILATAGSREFKMDGFRINATPATDFTYHSIITTKELEKAKEKDTDTEEEPKKRYPAKKKDDTVTKKDKQLIQEQIQRMSTH